MIIEQLHLVLAPLLEKLQHLESQKVQLENEILETKKQIEQLSPFISLSVLDVPIRQEA